MAADADTHASFPVGGSAQDPSALVTKKPSALPEIYEYLYSQETARPTEIQHDLDVSKSVTYTALDKLQAVNLVDKVSRGVYGPAEISLAADQVHVLGELRSQKQYDICQYAAAGDTFHSGDLMANFEGSRSNLRAAAVQLHETEFLDRWWKSFEDGPRGYRATQRGRQAVDMLQVEKYLGLDGSEVSAVPSGIECTEFTTPYEVEDVHYLIESGQDPVAPKTVAEDLEKDWKQTLKRLSKLEENGLVTAEPWQEKMLFEASRKTRSLFHHLRLWTISRGYELDLYTIAVRHGSGRISSEELYNRLVDLGYSPSVQQLNQAVADLKSAGVVEGNPLSGYSFTWI